MGVRKERTSFGKERWVEDEESEELETERGCGCFEITLHVQSSAGGEQVRQGR
jgi:hypothetical protein